MKVLSSFAAWGLRSCWRQGWVNCGKRPGSRRWEELLSEYLKSRITLLSLAQRIKELHHIGTLSCWYMNYKSKPELTPLHPHPPSPFPVVSTLHFIFPKLRKVFCLSNFRDLLPASDICLLLWATGIFAVLLLDWPSCLPLFSANTACSS